MVVFLIFFNIYIYIYIYIYMVVFLVFRLNLIWSFSHQTQFNLISHL